MSLQGLDFVQAIPIQKLMERIQSAIRLGGKLSISSVGFHALNTVAADVATEEVFRSMDIVLSDGISVIWASRMLDGRLDYSNRIGGDIVVANLYPIAAANEWGIFCLGGGSEPTLHTAIANLTAANAGLKIVGSRAWYPPSEDADVIVADEINRSGATIVLVGLGQPRQEAWIVANKDRISAAVFVAVGGYFEHAARSADCYPAWVYRWHLNWAYRLFQEPGRLWKRYLFGMTRFAFEVLKCRIVNGRDDRHPASDGP